MASHGRVLIIVENLPVPLDRRVWLEATTLTSAGHKVSVICPKGRTRYRKSHETIDGIHIFRYPPPPEASGVAAYVLEFGYCWLATLALSLRVLFLHGFDIIHACNPPDTFFALAALYKLIGKRFIFDHHDLCPEMYLAKGGRKGGLLHRFLLLLERLTFRTADIVIATNESHKQIALQRGNVPKDRVYVVRSGPDLERLRPTPPEEDLKQGRPYLACYLGEMCPQDGVDQLLYAIKFYVDELGRTDTSFVLMGGGPAAPSLHELASQLNIDEWVTFTGRVSDGDLCRYLSTADVCLDPDPLTEWSDKSTMNKIVEYMAFAKPIVAFDLKENRFSAGEAAVYASGNNTREYARLISNLLNDAQERDRMGKFGRARVEESLSWEHSAPVLLDAYTHAMINRTCAAASA